MVAWLRLATLLVACALTACTARDKPVDPDDYEAFFLWPGVSPPAALRRARTIYLLGGEVRHNGPARLVRLRQVPRLRRQEVWLTIRTERLDWDEAVYQQLLDDAAAWEAAGNHLGGVQIDFDAATKGLAGYAQFLSGLRRRLPARYRLSVTGLLDWSANGDPAQLRTLAGIVDEAVIQTYQGRRTISGYEGYLRALERVPLPYRIGLIEGGEWREPPGFRRDPEFRGYVVFLLGD